MDHEYDVLDGYIPSLVQHLKDTAARLGLRVGQQANEDQINAEEAVEQDVEPHALSTWTPAEQDAFFRAVSVYSRWRPDLIAACVPTKTEWEVWMYLEALEEGAAALAQQEGGKDMEIETADVEMHVDGSASDSRSHSGSDMDEDGEEDLCEPAFEVSQAWIDIEERMAAWIVDREHLASTEGEASADNEKAPRRKRGRPRKSGGETISEKGSPPPACRSQSIEPLATSSRKRSPSRNTSMGLEQKHKTLMSRLEIPHLLVLDSILREDEEATKEGSKSREGSVTAALPTENEDDGAPRVDEADMSSLSDRITGPPNIPEAPDALIDPVLLALSRGVDSTPMERRSSLASTQNSGASCAPARDLSPSHNVSSRRALLEISHQPAMINTFTFPRDNTIPTNPVPDASAETELSLFSPRSRRRIQKRLYMRRKRAMLRGDSAALEGVSESGIKKLKPGRRARTERGEASVAPTSVPCSEAPSDVEAELPECVPKKNKPGLTLPYKLKAQFTESGVDAAYLRSQGMDMLNLGALGRLMGLYSSLEHDEEGSAIAESVDAQLIRHLQAAMVSFVTDVMHRAIVWREREIRLKQRSRAWRQGDQFTIGAVEHAVAAIGARYHSHKAYFKSLEAFRGHTLEAPSAPGNATEEPSSRDASADPDAGAGDLPAGLSPHRDTYAPLICPPHGYRPSPLACLTRTYEREATRTRRGTSAEVDSDDLMGEDTDWEGLYAELEEEEERDERDDTASAAHEQALWAGSK